MEISDTFRALVKVPLVVQTAKLTLRYTSVSESANLTIVITDDDQIRELNQQYRNIDAPTDVLSFPTSHIDPDENKSYLGDVLISFPRAQAQSADGGHEIEDELQLLIVHGVLHLLGYNHADNKEKQLMWQVQAEILSQLGCSITHP